VLENLAIGPRIVKLEARDPALGEYERKLPLLRHEDAQSQVYSKRSR